MSFYLDTLANKAESSKSFAVGRFRIKKDVISKSEPEPIKGNKKRAEIVLHMLRHRKPREREKSKYSLIHSSSRCISSPLRSLNAIKPNNVLNTMRRPLDL